MQISALAVGLIETLVRLDPEPTFLTLYTSPKEFRALIPRKQGLAVVSNDDKAIYTPFVAFVAGPAVTTTSQSYLVSPIFISSRWTCVDALIYPLCPVRVRMHHTRVLGPGTCKPARWHRWRLDRAELTLSWRKSRSQASVPFADNRFAFNTPPLSAEEFISTIENTSLMPLLPIGL